MPAYTKRWTKSSNAPNETTFECKAYDAEVIAPELDTSEVQQQMKHAQEQLALSRQYPGRDHPTLPRAPRLRVME
jgi:hypothetical protein